MGAPAFHLSSTTVAARMNLSPPPAPATVPRPLRGGSMGQPPAQGRSVFGAVNGAPATSGTGAVTSTSSATDAQGPAPGSTTGGAAPPSASAAAATFATLPPAVRTLAKFVPFVAAVFFFQKGDHTLAAVSAAAGGAALVWL